ncbi:hypothetical protein [Conexibacter sp. SYSU D00693]|uniref:hypothetical protein n=1 Tax=Conexibacter sp. SYSU D00693 TaxID=2812560 RepID=UPI00196A74DB|nr:hypothetical protein [Conexibacter sp. SYSU D00693]
MDLRKLLALSVVLGMFGPAPASASTGEVLASESRPTTVTTYGDHTLWSHFDARSKRYRLVDHRSGRTVTVPVRGQRVPFDVDAGPDRGGRPVAVYSRCSGREPHLGDGRADGLPLHYAARGCRLFQVDLGTGREHKLNVTARKGFSQFRPSIWKGRIAYASRRDRSQADIALLLQRLEGRRPRSLRPGPRESRAGTVPYADSVDLGPLSLDLRGTRVAVVWASNPPDEGEPAGCGSGAEVKDGGTLRTTLLVVSTRRSTTLDSECTWFEVLTRVGASWTLDGQVTSAQLKPSRVGRDSILTTFGKDASARPEPLAANAISVTASGVDRRIVVTEPTDAQPDYRVVDIQL